LTLVAIGGLLDRLESGCFVERRADASDGRARRVFLTRAGAKLVNTIRAGVERIELEILDRIPEKDLNQAAATLLMLKETLLEKIGEDAEREGDSEGSDQIHTAAAE
jgi:DNA-binding MarR family transcriptional regulator